MRPLSVLFLILLASASYGLYQADFYDFKGGTEYDYETYRKETREPLFSEKFIISRADFNGDDFVVISTNGKAREKNREKIDKNTITYYAVKNHRLSTYYHENHTLKADRPYLSFKINFDWGKMKAGYSLTDALAKKNEASSLPLSGRTVLTHDLGLFFQDMILNKKNDEPFTVLFPNGRMLNLRAKFTGVDKVVTQAGTFLCRRIEMKPDFMLVSLFVPSVKFWFMAAPPYGYVRYEGPERGLRSPTVVQELVRINKL